jgi:hypothetical protein
MAKRHAARAGRGAVPYEIRIRGTLSTPLVGPLEGMKVESAGEESRLVCDIVDQAQLRGVLAWLGDLGVEIVSVNALGERAGDR